MKPADLLNRALLTVFCLAFAVLAISCKKKKEFKNETAQTTVDNRRAMGEMDEVVKDVNTVIMEQFNLRGRSARSVTTSVCGAKVDASLMINGRVVLTYDGSDCFGRTRTGRVIFTIEDYPLRKWKQKDCVVKIEYQGYRARTGTGNRIVEIDGVQEMVNETGGSWFDLWYGGLPLVTYRLTGTDVKVTFNGSNSSFFNVDRKLTFTYADEITTCRVEGAGSHLGKSRVEAWGISTSTDEFAASVTSPYTWKTTCGAVAALSGKVEIALKEKEYVLECNFGVDDEGSAAKGDKCPFGWEVTWSRKNKTNSRLFGYY